MRQQNILAFLIVALLLAGTATAYNGKQLAREAVDIGPLTDQNGEQYLFNTDAEGVVVVSFIFTRCRTCARSSPNRSSRLSPR